MTSFARLLQLPVQVRLKLGLGIDEVRREAIYTGPASDGEPGVGVAIAAALPH